MCFWPQWTWGSQKFRHACPQHEGIYDFREDKGSFLPGVVADNLVKIQVQALSVQDLGFGVQGFPAAPTSSRVMVDSQTEGAASCYFLDVGLIRYDLGGSCHGRLDLSVMKPTCVQTNCLSSLQGHGNTTKTLRRASTIRNWGLTEIIV